MSLHAVAYNAQKEEGELMDLEAGREGGGDFIFDAALEPDDAVHVAVEQRRAIRRRHHHGATADSSFLGGHGDDDLAS